MPPDDASDAAAAASETAAFAAVIADDHAILRHAVRAVLGQVGGFRIVAEAGDGLEAIAMVRRHRPALLTLDLAMPYAQGIGVFHEARRWSPDTRVVVFTGLTSRHLLGELVREGVDGLFMKNGDPQLLADALPLVMGGARVIAPEVSALVEDAPAQGLTAREAQVLRLIAMGHANKAIAEHLGVSFKTVDHHRTNLMRKLGVHSTAELLGYALREGYLDHSRET